MAEQAKDWLQWHEPYQDPASPLSRRLAIVQHQIQHLLPRTIEKPLQVVSICAGQGDDILGVLETLPQPDHIHTRLVERDARNAAAARRHVEARQLKNVEIILGDAALLSAYEGAVPADIVLACGIFGNISDQDIFKTISTFPQLCAPRAGVVWTRSRRPPDMTPRIRDYFMHHGFSELDFVAPDDVQFSVGVNRYEGDTQPLCTDGKMFTFLV